VGHFRQLTHPFHTLLFEDQARVDAALSVERWHPFYDHRLVEFCLALPPEQKLDRGWSRVVMRRAMSGILPTEVQWRPGKTAFDRSIVHSLFVHQRPSLEETLLSEPGHEAKYIDVAALRRTYERLIIDGSPSPSNEELLDFSMALWFMLWLRHALPDKGVASNLRRESMCGPGAKLDGQP